MAGEEYEFSESDCCGNGCRNCVLNIKPQILVKSNKKNIIYNYTKFIVIEKTAMLPEILELCFQSVSATADYMLDIPAGHHLMMRAPIMDAVENSKANAKKYLLRPYSPFFTDVFKLQFKILVNLTPQGEMSKYISNLQLNDKVEFRGPIGTYEHKPDKQSSKCIFIVTQGVAISPTLPIVENILNNEDDLSQVFHLVCCRDMRHIYFRQRLLDFNKYWNYRSKIYLSRQYCESAECKAKGGCTEQCEDFKDSLRYKELVFPRRLTALDLEDTCQSANGGENIFIVSGTLDFQDLIASYVKSSELNVKSKNVYLL